MYLEQRKSPSLPKKTGTKGFFPRYHPHCLY